MVFHDGLLGSGISGTALDGTSLVCCNVHRQARLLDPKATPPWAPGAGMKSDISVADVFEAREIEIDVSGYYSAGNESPMLTSMASADFTLRKWRRRSRHSRLLSMLISPLIFTNGGAVDNGGEQFIADHGRVGADSKK